MMNLIVASTYLHKGWWWWWWWWWWWRWWWWWLWWWWWWWWWWWRWWWRWRWWWWRWWWWWWWWWSWHIPKWHFKIRTLPQFRRGATSGLHRTCFNMFKLWIVFFFPSGPLLRPLQPKKAPRHRRASKLAGPKPATATELCPATSPCVSWSSC